MTDPTPTFADLGLDDRLLAALEGLGFSQPTPIQGVAVPPLLEGRDVIGQARTGSGKTAAYGLPLLHRVNDSTGRVRALVLAPTRELALQITDALRDLAKKLPVRIVTVYGGAPYPPQLKALAKGVPIVVGTPGRVLDHLARGSLDVSAVEVLVLDEADEMLRMGFVEAVEEVLAACPDDRQIALLSATMPTDIQRIASTYLRDPVKLEMGDDGPRVDHIEQRWIRVPNRYKLDALERVLRITPEGATIVFVRTRASCAEVADVLAQRGVAVDALHGDLNQSARERVLQRLRARQLRVVVATDVAARGIDVDHLDRVINLDLPMDVDTYVHRIGRTARAGREGEAITFVTPQQRRKMGAWARKLGVDIREVNVPTDAEIARYQQGRVRRRLQATAAEADLTHASRWVDELVEEGFEPTVLAATLLHEFAGQVGLELAPPPAEPAQRPAPVPADGDHVEVFVSVGERQGVRPKDLVGALTNEAGVPFEAIGKIHIAHRKSFVGLPLPIARELVERHPEIEIRGHRARLAPARRGDRPVQFQRGRGRR